MRAFTIFLALAWCSVVFGDELHDAARQGNVAKVKAMLEANPKLVSNEDENGFTLLVIAAYDGYLDMTKMLLAHKADINASDTSTGGGTALHAAVYSGHKDLVELLLANKANPNVKDWTDKTPLCYVTDRSLDVAKLLLAHKADVNARDNMGGTPLFDAAFTDQKAVMKLLLENGADVNARDNEGDTALDSAAMGTGPQFYCGVAGPPPKSMIVKSTKAVAELLVAYKADVNARDNGGGTSLQTAALMGNKEVAVLLLAKKADVTARDKDGGTALDYAVDGNHIDLVELLLAHKADINTRDKKGKTPLQHALKYDEKEMAAFLRQRGGHE